MIIYNSGKANVILPNGVTIFPSGTVIITNQEHKSWLTDSKNDILNTRKPSEEECSRNPKTMEKYLKCIHKNDYIFKCMGYASLIKNSELTLKEG